jgi:hypothetical protein
MMMARSEAFCRLGRATGGPPGEGTCPASSGDAQVTACLGITAATSPSPLKAPRRYSFLTA